MNVSETFWAGSSLFSSASMPKSVKLKLKGGGYVDPESGLEDKVWKDIGGISRFLPAYRYFVSVASSSCKKKNKLAVNICDEFVSRKHVTVLLKKW